MKTKLDDLYIRKRDVKRLQFGEYDVIMMSNVDLGWPLLLGSDLKAGLNGFRHKSNWC